MPKTTSLKTNAQRRAKSLRNLANDPSTTSEERQLAQQRMGEICARHDIDPAGLDDVEIPRNTNSCPARLTNTLANLRGKIQHIKLRSLLHDRREDYALIFAGLERAVEIAEEQAKRLKRPARIGVLRRPQKAPSVQSIRRKYL